MRRRFEILSNGTAEEQQAIADWREEAAAQNQEQIFHLVKLSIPGEEDQYLVDANYNVTYMGVEHTKFPFKYNGSSINSDGTIDNATIELANVTRDLMFEIENYDGLRGSTLQVKTISAKFVDYLYEYVEHTRDRGVYDAQESYQNNDKTLYSGTDHVYLAGTWYELVEPNVYRRANPNATSVDLAVEDFFVVASYSATREVIQLQLAPVYNVDARLPRRRYVADTCYFRFKGTECGYSGPLTTCSKRLNGADGCEGRDNTLRFGGFPGVNRTRRVVI